MANRVRRVCYVEDSPELRTRVLSEMSRLDSIEVVGFSESSEDAIRQIRCTQPDLVVLDLQLADGSGFDVLRAFFGVAGAPTMIVLTNHSDALSRELSLRAGAQYVFDKSVEFEDFLLLLEKIGR